MPGLAIWNPDSGEWVYVGGSGPTGPAGPAGPAGPGSAIFEWSFDPSTTMADPGSGDIRFNNATILSATILAISTTTVDAVDAYNVLKRTAAGDIIEMQESADASQWVRLLVTGDPVDHTTWFEIPIDVVDGAGTTVHNNVDILVAFSRQTGLADSYHHIQSAAATTWTVDHMLGRHPNVSVLDSAGSQVEVAVYHASLDQVVLTLSYAVSGTADCS